MVLLAHQLMLAVLAIYGLLVFLGSLWLRE